MLQKIYCDESNQGYQPTHKLTTNNTKWLSEVSIFSSSSNKNFGSGKCLLDNVKPSSEAILVKDSYQHATYLEFTASDHRKIRAISSCWYTCCQKEKHVPLEIVDDTSFKRNTAMLSQKLVWLNTTKSILWTLRPTNNSEEGAEQVISLQHWKSWHFICSMLSATLLTCKPLAPYNIMYSLQYLTCYTLCRPELCAS